MKIDLKVEALKRSWLFRDLRIDGINEIASLAVSRRFDKGESIFHEGDLPKFLYVITSGKVKQFKSSLSGRSFTVFINSFGDPLNVMALFGAKSSFASAQAIGETKTLVIAKKDFLSFVEKHPIVMTRLIYVMGMIVNSVCDRLSDLAGETASQRVFNVLHMLYRKFGNHTVSFTREEIADFAGTTPETAVRVLSSLKAAGIIETKRGRIVILDEMKLRDMCRRSYKVPLFEVETS